MDGISARISLIDTMSGPLLDIANMTSELINRVQAIQAAGSDLGSTMPFDGMRQQIDESASAAQRLNDDIAGTAAAAQGVDSPVRQIGGTIQDNERGQQRFNDAMRQGGGAADTLLGKIGQIGAAIGVAFGVKQAVDFFGGSIDLTNQQIQAEQQLVNVLANQGASYEDFIALKQEAASIQGKSMYGDEAMIGGAAELATYIKDVDALQHMMGTLSNYAAGMSGGAEISFQQMTDYATQLGKALDGTFDGLKKKGFELSDVQKAIIQSSSLEELTEQGVTLSAEYQQLVQDNYELAKAMVIDDVISQSWDGLAEQMAATPAGMAAQMKNAFGDVRENIGAQLMPAIMGVMSAIKDNMPQIESALSRITPFISGIIDAGTWLIDTVSSLGSSFDGLGGSVSGILEAIQHAAGPVISQVVSAVQGAVTYAVGLIERISPSIQAMVANAGPILSSLVNIVIKVASNFSWVGDVIAWLADVAATTFEFLNEAMEYLEPVIYGVVAAWVAWEAAQIALNIAMNANPIGLIVLAIAAVVAAIAVWAQSIGGFKVAWLTVVNAVLTAWDALRIGFFTGINFVLDLWDKMAYGISSAGAAVADFMGDMKAKTLMILQNLVNEAIAIINSFIAALNALPPVEIAYIQQVTFGTEAALKNEADRQVRAAELAEQKAQMDARINERAEGIGQMKTDADAAAAKRLAEIDVARRDAEQKEIDKKIEALQNVSTNPTEPLPTPESYVNTSPLMGEGGGGGGGDGGPGSMGGIAGNTGRTAANTARQVDISEENLKYLRDIAERDTVNRFTTAEVNIEMGGVSNSVNSEMDLDGIISYLAEGTREALLEVAEGVHF